MKTLRSILVRFLALNCMGLMVLLPTLALPQATVTAPPVRAVPAPTPEPPITLGFDDLMTLLIQPRHLKLFYAGMQGNWELAAAEMRDLRAGLALIATAHPKYLNNDVQAAIATMMAPQLLNLEEAIGAANSKGFASKFKDLTEACNACHTYMEHPYIVIKVPNSPARSTYPDQDFSARP